MSLLTTLTLCWRLERRDGVAIGLTAHDRDLAIDGLVYRAAPGMVPSAITRSATLEPGSMDVAGALTNRAIGEADLLAGRWDGARIAVFATDWNAPGDPIPLGEGTLGAVETRGDSLTGELRGAAAALDRPVVEETSPACRATLGDARCRVPMAGRRRMTRVVGAEGALLTLDGHEPAPDAYGGGRLRWLTGANSGLEDAVRQSAEATVTLRRPPRFAAEGALVEVTEGCDKRIETCAGRFGNAANFRGEPFLPGMDLLTRYPGS